MASFSFQNYVIHNQDPHYPVLAKNADLRIELVASNLSFPTNMAFLDHSNILVLEKNTGDVRLISDGMLRPKPLLRLNVEGQGEGGLLGLAILNNTSPVVESGKDKKGQLQSSSSSLSPTHLFPPIPKAYAFIYYTELKKTGESKNVIYRYDWNGNSLINPKLILELPSSVGIYHNGGKMIIGPRDHQLYVTVGDLNSPNTVMQNYKYGKKSSYSSVILRINPISGLPSADNPFLNDKISDSTTDIAGLAYSYAYGIRNSFGMAFDPVTGFLWDTENGENTYDEINLVKSGFNSGWDKVMGPISRNNDSSTKSKLFDLPGSCYSDPKFSWLVSIGVTAIEFFNSSNFGIKYKNNIFIGDINLGNIYYFEVNNTNRTDLNLNDGQHSGLIDRVAHNKNEALETLFATNFQGRITDIKTGPDGNLYVLTYFDGKVYKITPKNRLT
jgi:glucose/arabinose dehydrogenase